MLQRTASPPAAPSTRPRAAHTERKSEASRLFPTKNDLPEATRSQVADLLNQRLADCIDLQTQCKQAHWNVKGPAFIALHKLFDDVNEDVEEYVDLVAERVVQLGGIAQGTARMAADRSTLEEYPQGLASGEGHVDALSSALAAFGSGTRKAIDQVDELDDADTVDILTQISRGTDKWLWFVEAHQQGEAQGQGRR
ncbi:MAG: starvation-inducible DNA-binding protein [Gemmatimonadales bacterium]|jgi:starvation-inducible DNA-binding protein|nr:starvation-inducible DNA-binding protein [Gemmatimonadales bacterium]